MRLIPSTNPNRKSGYVLGILSRLFGTTQIASSYPGLTSWTTFSNLQPSLRDWHIETSVFSERWPNPLIEKS
jgi:hypothetical protein